LYFTAVTKNVKGQVVIDWNKSHTGSFIDYIGSDGGDWSASIVNGNQFRITKKANHQDIIIHYISFDKKEWTASLNGDKFYHTPNGPWGDAHLDTRMDYIQSDNAECSATISGDDFIITNHNTNQTSKSHFLYYITWNSSHWTAALAKPYFQHWEGNADNTVKIVSYLSYLTWNSSKWTASIMQDGSFKHTDENGNSHIDRNIIYLNYDRSIWGAKLDNNMFVHAYAFIPKEKTFGDKSLEVIHGMGLGNGFPEQSKPSQNSTATECVVTVKNNWGTLEVYGVRFKVGQHPSCGDLVDLGTLGKGASWTDSPVPKGWNLWLVFKTNKSGGCGSGDTKYEINGLGDFTATKYYVIN